MDLQALELSFLLHLQELHTPVLDGIMTVITHLGDGGVLFIAMGVLMLFFSRTRKVGLAVLLSLLGGFLVGNLLLKNLVGRDRPCWLMPEVLIIRFRRGTRWRPLRRRFPFFYTIKNGGLLRRFWRRSSRFPGSTISSIFPRTCWRRFFWRRSSRFWCTNGLKRAEYVIYLTGRKNNILCRVDVRA